MFLPIEVLSELKTYYIAWKNVLTFALIILRILNLLQEALTKSEPPRDNNAFTVLGWIMVLYIKDRLYLEDIYL
jgi:hypothetical protein